MNSTPSPDIADANRLAGEQMEKGIALIQGSGAPEDLREALRCFDEAIALRRDLPLAENPEFRYGLAAGWINRADVLMRLGGQDGLTEAVSAYTKGIELLDKPPADDAGGSFAIRLAIAWMNRGVALEAQRDNAGLAEAARSYREAIRELEGAGPLADDRAVLVLASAWTNLGNVSLRQQDGPQPAQACEAVEKALALLAGSEATELPAAEAGLKARHILCQAVTMMLAAGLADPERTMDWIDKMTDTVEAGLNLELLWEKAGVTSLLPMAPPFYHLGALLYERHQPHFLVEFLMEHLESRAGLPGGDGVWLEIASASLARARRGLMEGDFAALATEGGVAKLRLLSEIREADERIQALRQRAHQAPTGALA